MSKVSLSLKQRLVVFFLYSATAYLAYSALVTGGPWKPSGGGSDLWFLSVVGLAAVRLIETPFFRKPSDSLLAGFTTSFSLWSLDLSEALQATRILGLVRWSGVVYAIGIMVVSIISISLHQSAIRRAKASKIVYRLSTKLGVPEMMFTFPVFLAAFGFHNETSIQLCLTGTWLLMCVAKPMEEIYMVILALCHREHTRPPKRVGVVKRIDSPNLLRVALDDAGAWTTDKVHVAGMPDGTCAYVLPLFRQISSDGSLGTGYVASSGPDDVEVERGSIIEMASQPKRSEVMAKWLGAEVIAPLVGFVVEGSSIARIMFEVSSEEALKEGDLVFCQAEAEPVYYQIVAAHTFEENFNRNPRGTIRVTATQLGTLDQIKKFVWHPWVPPMNTPVFRSEGVAEASLGDKLAVGTIPGTSLNAELDFERALEFHTAVLGSTGMGKTELVFDIIRHGIARGAKVFCVDFTGEYKLRLADLNPVGIGLETMELEKLDELVENVEVGKYGAADEKKALSTFLAGVRPKIAEEVASFLVEDDSSIAILELEDIANTRATLRTTEIYLSEIFGWARKNRKARKTLLVLEEAHTIIPEINLYSHDKNETQAVVGRMSQIALQGRKYGVGILLVSQRTALVSKTVLSQCNTHLCFAIVDRTSLEYLGNVLGSDHLETLPNLRQRQLIVHGVAISGDRPLIVERPYDPEKEAASKKLDVALPGARPNESSNKENIAIEDDDGLPF